MLTVFMLQSATTTISAKNTLPGNIIAPFCKRERGNEIALRRAANVLLQDKGKKAPIFGAGILEWLNASHQERIDGFLSYRNIFLTTKGEARRQYFPTKAVLEIDPECAEILSAEAQRILDLEETRKRAKSAEITRDLLIVGHAVLKEYTKLKKEQAVLDFDDLILRTDAFAARKNTKLCAIRGTGCR